MSLTAIFQKIGFFSSFIALIIGALQYFDLLGENVLFTWICWGFFTLIVVVMILLSSTAIKAKKMSTNVYVILGSIGLKFMMSLALVLTYLLLAKPASPSFILPFMLFYFTYTGLAVYYLLQLFKVKKT